MVITYNYYYYQEELFQKISSTTFHSAVTVLGYLQPIFPNIVDNSNE